MLVAVHDGAFTPVQRGFYIVTFTVKVILDGLVIGMFVHLFSYFIFKKRQALQKGTRGFSAFNVFMLYAIYAMVFMRVLGALYTFIVGIVSLTPLFQND